jgi:hypothetical protein
MDAAIKDIVVPHMRGLGFKGSLPHFRRERAGAADLLGFQFRSIGGSFVVEIGRLAAEGFDFHGRHIALAKANVTYLAHRLRHRLGAPLTGGDHWFAFAERDPQAVAREVIAELDRDDVWALIDSWPVHGA